MSATDLRPGGRLPWAGLALAAFWCLLLVALLGPRWNPQAMARLLAGSSPGWLAPALLAYALSLWIRSLRWSVVLGPVPLSPGQLLRATILQIWWVNVLPARTGDLSLLYLLRRHAQVAYARSAGALVAARLADLAVLAGTASASLIFLWDLVALAEVWAGVLALTAAAALGILLLAPLVTGQVLTLLGGRLPRLLAPLATLRESLGRAGTARVLGAMLCLSLVSQTLIYLTYGLLLRAAGLDVPLFGALLVFSLVEAASVLPVHGLLSLGSQEAVWAAGLNLLGVDALQGAAAGLLVHSGFLLFSSLAAGAAVLPIPRRPRR